MQNGLKIPYLSTYDPRQHDWHCILSAEGYNWRISAGGNGVYTLHNDLGAVKIDLRYGFDADGYAAEAAKWDMERNNGTTA